MPAHPSEAASGLSLWLAATRPLSTTPLHPSAVSARFGPAELLADAVTATSRLWVPLAGSPAPSAAEIAARQQHQEKKSGRPPKDPGELSNNPWSKWQQEFKPRLAGEKKEASHLKLNDRVAHSHARKAVKKTDDWLKA